MRTAVVVAMTGAACLTERLGQVMQKCLQVRMTMSLMTRHELVAVATGADAPVAVVPAAAVPADMAPGAVGRGVGAGAGCCGAGGRRVLEHELRQGGEQRGE